MKKSKIKVKRYSAELINLRKYIRSLGEHHVPYYDFLGRTKGQKLIPLYYGDTLKFCYPDLYFKKEEVLNIVKKTKQYIKQNNYDVDIDYEDNYWIGGLHCRGYKLRIKGVE